MKAEPYGSLNNLQTDQLMGKESSSPQTFTAYVSERERERKREREREEGRGRGREREIKQGFPENCALFTS